MLVRIQQIKVSDKKNSSIDEMKKLEIELKQITHKMSVTDEARFRLRNYFLANAEVVCTTLPSCVTLFK